MASSASPFFNSSTTSPAVPRRGFISRPANSLVSSEKYRVRRSRPTVCESASRSEPTSPPLIADARERAPDRAVVALLQQWQHSLAQVGQLRLRPLPPE